MNNDTARWPSLPLEEWQDTYATLHRWCQIVGKIRLACTPWINHSWHVTLYLTVRGLTTSPMPYGAGSFQIDFDFIDHQLVVRTSAGDVRSLPLRARSVAAFHADLMARLRELGIEVSFHGRPSELEPAIPFEQDEEHAAYDRDAAQRCWRILAQSEPIFTAFRARFLGKCSPVHFFWGAFDLAVTRFSGRTAPPHPGGVPELPDWVVREAYSHEVCSAGFWPGGSAVPYPTFYSYAYPEPDGYCEARVAPSGAFYSAALGEFLLPYDAVRTAASPGEALLAFLQSSYDAAADFGGWDRAALERAAFARA